LEHRSLRLGLDWLMLFVATAVTCACGATPPKHTATAQAVLAAPSAVSLLSWITVELQDTLAAALPEGACVTKTTFAADAEATRAKDAPALESAPTQSWHYDACGVGIAGMLLSGERHLWTCEDGEGETKVRSRFAFSRFRSDGVRWLAEGQSDMSARQQVGQQVTQQRVLTHGTMTPSGAGVALVLGHAYAYHLRITEGLDGAATRRLSGVAQLNFGTLEATSQVKLSSLILAPECPWPVYGHVSVATTASDGSFVDAALLFTEACGVVKDDQGALTSLTMPWDEGA
jgi:hypothetical protein